jgi:hypothetical protein
MQHPAKEEKLTADLFTLVLVITNGRGLVKLG